MKRFILCYDITNEKRLSKIARRTERVGMRVQRSIYLFEGMSIEELVAFVETLMPFFDETSDDLRIYAIKYNAISLQSGVDFDCAYVV